MRKVLLGIIGALVISTPAIAVEPDWERDGFTVYQMIRDDSADEKLAETRSQVAACIAFLRGRLSKLEDRVAALENTSAINPADTLRIQTLEKKVHSLTEIVKMIRERKADKPVKKGATPAAIPLVDSNTDKTGYWQTFTTNPPTTEWVQFKPIAGSVR